MSDTVQKKQKKSTFILLGIGVAIIYFIMNYIKFEYFSAHLAEMSMAASVIFFIILVIQFLIAQYSVKLNDNTFEFKKVFQSLFLVLLIYEIGCVFGNYFYMFHINPEFIQEFYERNVTAVDEIYVNMDSDNKKMILSEILSMKDSTFSLYIQFYLKEVIFSSIAAFIICFITKFLNKSNTPYIHTQTSHNTVTKENI